MSRKWMAALLCILIMVAAAVPCLAVGESPKPKTNSTRSTTGTTQTQSEENNGEQTDAQKEEKKEKPKDFSGIQAPRAIVMDRASGFVLYEKNSDQQSAPGDLVKLMTALIVAEKCNMNDIVTTPQEVLDQVDPYSSATIALEAGEEASVQDMLYAMLLPSADDAALALAIHVAGSEAAFVELMNQRATELGMTHTRFTNVTGVQDAAQLSTAKDMAILSRAVLDNDLLAKAVGTDKFEFSATNTRPDPSPYFNSNYLVSAYTTPDYFYNNAVGLKSGYTEEGKYTLAAAANNGTGEVIAVLMGNERNQDDEITTYLDAQLIFDYVFENYAYTTIINTNQIIAEYDVPNAKGDGHVLLLCPTTKESFLPKNFSTEDLTFHVKLNRELTAPIQKGEVLGSAEVVYQGQTISNIELVSDRDLSRSLFKKLGFLRYIVLFIALLFLAMLGMRAYNLNQRKQRRKRREMSRSQTTGGSQRTVRRTAERPAVRSTTEVRRQAALERTARNLERSARLTDDRAKMRADMKLSRELNRHRTDHHSNDDKR